jgi:phage terminase Nu1 subunit (DNA packaging protein)
MKLRIVADDLREIAADEQVRDVDDRRAVAFERRHLEDD